MNFSIKTYRIGKCRWLPPIIGLTWLNLINSIYIPGRLGIYGTSSELVGRPCRSVAGVQDAAEVLEAELSLAGRVGLAHEQLHIHLRAPIRHPPLQMGARFFRVLFVFFSHFSLLVYCLATDRLL